MFTTIFIYCLLALLAYYGVTIALDVLKSKNAENTKDSSEEIEVDISEEAKQFMPTEVSRFEKQEVEESYDNPEEIEEEYWEEDEPQEPQISIADMGPEEVINIIGYIDPAIRNNANDNADPEEADDNQRKPNMLDGIDVNEFVSEIQILATKGGSKLGNIIYELEEAA